MATQSVISIRPAEQEVGVPQFSPSVVSSPSNIYLQEVQASVHDERRMSFTWRSPSSGLVLSPLAYIKFQVLVQSTCDKITREDMIGSLFGEIDGNIGAAVGAFEETLDDGEKRLGYRTRPLLMLGEGCSPENACESKQINLNGSQWSQLSGDLFNRQLDECFVPNDVAQRRWSTCGGPNMRYDSKIVSGAVMGLSGDTGINAAGTDTHTGGDCGATPVDGATADSSFSDRMRNFHDQVIQHGGTIVLGDVAGDIGVASHTVKLEIRFPVKGLVFNDLWGCSGLARSDPRLRMPLGIPNVNTGTITMAFRNLLQTCVRSLGRPCRFDQHVAAGVYDHGPLIASGTSTLDDNIVVAYGSAYVPRLELTWIRLPSFRSIPQSSALATYRRDVRRPNTKNFGLHAFTNDMFIDGQAKTGLLCCGDINAVPSTNVIRPATEAEAANAASTKFVDVEWTGVAFPQPPSALFFTWQKDTSVYSTKCPVRDTTAARAVAGQAGVKVALLQALAVAATDVQKTAIEKAHRYLAQNVASSASICQLELIVQSAIGSFSFRDARSPYLADRDNLWRRHRANCCDGYMKAGRGAWQKRSSCLLLDASDFLLGLQTSPGVSFPVQIDAKIKFANKNAVASGLCFTTGLTRGRPIFSDIMVGTPVMVGLFNNQILSIASSSAVLSAQAFSQSTFSSAVAQS